MITLDLKELSLTPLLIRQYLSHSTGIETLHDGLPNRINILSKAKTLLFSSEQRELLEKILNEQHLHPTSKQKLHLEKIGQSNTCTITCGHQLNLMGGPIYVFIKIIETVKLCDDLNKSQSDYHFVPIYWMASEDHDIQEINHFWIKNKRYTFPSEWKGTAGSHPLNKKELSQFFNSIDTAEFNRFQKEFFELAKSNYLSSKTLAEAHRNLFQKIFGEMGLLIFDANDKRLKQSFIPFFQRELSDSIIYNQTIETQKIFQKNHWKFVFARRVNAFYINQSKRQRIDKLGNDYLIGDEKKTQKELKHLLQKQPENFSPNVLLRPVYQQFILPNVAYIGGTAEISYWLQLKAVFIAFGVNFPILIPRNSILFLSTLHLEKLSKLQLEPQQWILPKNEWLSIIYKKFAESDSDTFKLSEQVLANLQLSSNDPISMKYLENFQSWAKKNWKKMERKIHKEKAKSTLSELQKVDAIFDELFPANDFQERHYGVLAFLDKPVEEFLREFYNILTPMQAKLFIFQRD